MTEPPLGIQAITFAILGLFVIAGAWVAGASPVAVTAAVGVVYFCWVWTVFLAPRILRALRRRGQV